MRILFIILSFCSLGRLSVSFWLFPMCASGSDCTSSWSCLTFSFSTILGSPNSSPRHGTTSHTDHHRHRDNRLHPQNSAHHQLREVICTVAHIKVRFHGGAAMICQFLTSLYIKMYKRHLEQQVGIEPSLFNFSSSSCLRQYVLNF